MVKSTNCFKQINRFIDSALKTMQKVVLEGNTYFYRIIEFPLKIIAVLGIFAGFGFTGISSVENIWLFAIAEFCFVTAVLVGLYWYKKIIVNHKVIYGKYVQRLDVYIKKWEKIGLDITEKGYDDEEFKKHISRMQNQLAKIFKEKPKVSDCILNVILWIFGVATILLLVSFLPINWSKIFNYLLSVTCFC